jgi:hypothetical protein
MIKSLITPNEKGEVMAEVKGFAETFKKATGFEPRVFPGVLISGVVFLFPDTLFMMKDRRYILLNHSPW